MGSLSWSPQPSGPHHITPHHLTKMGPGTVFHLIILIASALSLDTDRSVVKYLGDTFLLPDGCPVNDPMVQRFYKLCLESHQNAPLCTKERLSRAWMRPKQQHALTEQGRSFPTQPATEGFRFSNPQSRTQHFSLDRCWTGLLVEKSTSSEQRYCNISTCHKPRSIHIHQ